MGSHLPEEAGLAHLGNVCQLSCCELCSSYSMGEPGKLCSALWPHAIGYSRFLTEEMGTWLKLCQPESLSLSSGNFAFEHEKCVIYFCEWHEMRTRKLRFWMCYLTLYTYVTAVRISQEMRERGKEKSEAGRESRQRGGGWWKEADTAYVPFGFPDPALSSFWSLPSSPRFLWLSFYLSQTFLALLKLGWSNSVAFNCKFHK